MMMAIILYVLECIYGRDNFNDRSISKKDISLTTVNSSMLTPIHLRKAKLMFFWVRYPSSSILKMYFPDIRFNKNNTAQLVKWFSNFRWVQQYCIENLRLTTEVEGLFQSSNNGQDFVTCDQYKYLQCISTFLTHSIYLFQNYYDSWTIIDKLSNEFV